MPIDNKALAKARVLSGNSSGGAPSDWNAAEGEPGHVLNRTHWEENSESVLFDGTVTKNTNSSEPKITLASDLISGEKYEVVYGGVVYELTATDDGYGSVIIGDFDCIEYPFAIYGGDGWYFTSSDPKGTYELTIKNSSIVVRRLDEKYMPLLTSPNGTKYLLSVDDTGALTATPTA